MSAIRVRRLVPVVALGAMLLAPHGANALGCTPNIICPPTATAEVGVAGTATR